MTKRMQNTRANPKIPSFDKTMEIVFAVSAWVSIISVVLITVYIFAADCLQL